MMTSDEVRPFQFFFELLGGGISLYSPPGAFRRGRVFLKHGPSFQIFFLAKF